MIKVTELEYEGKMMNVNNIDTKENEVILSYMKNEKKKYRIITVSEFLDALYDCVK